MNICIYIYIYIHIHTYIGNQTYIQHDLHQWVASTDPVPVTMYMTLTVGFHNFNLRIFNLRVSNPNKLIVDVFVDTMSDFNVPGSRPNKNTM